MISACAGVARNLIARGGGAGTEPGLAWELGSGIRAETSFWTMVLIMISASVGSSGNSMASGGGQEQSQG